MNRYVKLVPALFLAMSLGACAAQKDKTSTQDVTQAVRDFVEVRELESLEAIRVFPADSMKKISGIFILYKGRQSNYIMEFDRYCMELDDYRVITPDRRWDLNSLRVRVDTIRGCRIANIWSLSDEELAELKNIGAVPGEHS